MNVSIVQVAARAWLERVLDHLITWRTEARTLEEWDTTFDASETVARILREWK